MTMQMKAIEQYFQLLLSIMLHELVLSCKRVGETLVLTIQMKAIEQYISVVIFS